MLRIPNMLATSNMLVFLKYISSIKNSDAKNRTKFVSSRIVALKQLSQDLFLFMFTHFHRKAAHTLHSSLHIGQSVCAPNEGLFVPQRLPQHECFRMTVIVCLICNIYFASFFFSLFFFLNFCNLKNEAQIIGGKV